MYCQSVHVHDYVHIVYMQVYMYMHVSRNICIYVCETPHLCYALCILGVHHVNPFYE